MFSIIYMVLIGLCAGAAAQYLSPGEDPGNLDNTRGIAITVLIGILGSVVGGVIGRVIQLKAAGFFGEIILAIVGSLVLLWIYKRYFK